MSIDIMRGLLRDFGAGIGLPQLSPDEQGYCCLRIGEEITISLQYEPEAQNLVLFARLCQIDETASEAANEMMLAGNMFWGQTRGATLAVEPVERIVFLLAKEAVVSLDLPKFTRLLEGFVETGESWRRRLRPFEAAAAPEPTPAAIPLDYIKMV